MRRASISVFAATLLVASGCMPDVFLEGGPHDAAIDVADVGSDARAPCSTKAGPMADLGTHCVDLTEVTKAEYQRFLDSAPSPFAQPTECRWNVDFAPLSAPSAVDSSCDVTFHPDVNDAAKFPNRPVVCVDWCDAQAYCAWAGKHLCGRIGGGTEGTPTDDGNVIDDAARSEWDRACVGPDATAYPYGASFDPAACHYDPSPTSPTRLFPVDVASTPSCHGKAGTPWAAIYDLSGNVAEWTDSCNRPQKGVDPATQSCTARGGWWRDDRTGDPLGCAATPDRALVWPRSRADDHIGFRCCG